MPEQLVSGNDIDVVIKAGGDKAGTTDALGRIVAESVSVSKSEDNTVESGLGHNQPDGRSNGNTTYSWELEVKGHDKNVLGKVITTDSDEGGLRSVPFDMTLRHIDEDGTLQWEYSLTSCKENDTDLLDFTQNETGSSSLSGDALRVRQNI